MAPSTAPEPQVRYFSPMPPDYEFVPKGDVYITSNVRKRTHAVGATLYVVVDKHRKPIGLRCPKFIHQEVAAAAEASAAGRAAVVQLRDAAVERGFEAELLRLYPQVPRGEVEKILGQALEKRSRRVGRTGTLTLESKVHLAVRAHIRHCHTPYEQLLEEGMEREEARQEVSNKLQEVARLWTGTATDAATGTRADTIRQMKAQGHPPRARRRARTTKLTNRPSRRVAQPGSKTSETAGDSEDGSDVEESEEDAILVLS